jgi:hypothetical protein
MLQYTRRAEVLSSVTSSINNVSSNIELDRNPILTYCNWNYRKKYHLTSKELKSIIKEFDSTKIPYYVRIFNEIPTSIIQYFIDNNDLLDADLQDIWSKITMIKGLRLQENFWQEYNSLRAS